MGVETTYRGFIVRCTKPDFSCCFSCHVLIDANMPLRGESLCVWTTQTHCAQWCESFGNKISNYSTSQSRFSRFLEVCVCVCVCGGGGGAGGGECGWLYESPSEVGGALLVKYLCTCARSVTTVNSSRVTSAQVKNPVCVFIFKNRKKKRATLVAFTAAAAPRSSSSSSSRLPPSTRLSFYFYVFQRHIPLAAGM